MSLRSERDQEALYEDIACRDAAFTLYWQALERHGHGGGDEKRRQVRAHWCEAWSAARRARWNPDMGQFPREPVPSLLR